MTSLAIDSLIVAVISALLRLAGVGGATAGIAWTLVVAALVAAVGLLISDHWVTR
jgi:uncharacterized membrane protein YtjA (UPF0391 family)